METYFKRIEVTLKQIEISEFLDYTNFEIK